MLDQNHDRIATARKCFRYVILKNLISVLSVPFGFFSISHSFNLPEELPVHEYKRPDKYHRYFHWPPFRLPLPISHLIVLKIWSSNHYSLHRVGGPLLLLFLFE